MSNTSGSWTAPPPRPKQYTAGVPIPAGHPAYHQLQGAAPYPINPSFPVRMPGPVPGTQFQPITTAVGPQVLPPAYMPYAPGAQPSSPRAAVPGVSVAPVVPPGMPGALSAGGGPPMMPPFPLPGGGFMPIPGIHVPLNQMPLTPTAIAQSAMSQAAAQSAQQNLPQVPTQAPVAWPGGIQMPVQTGMPAMPTAMPSPAQAAASQIIPGIQGILALLQNPMAQEAVAQVLVNSLGHQSVQAKLAETIQAAAKAGAPQLRSADTGTGH